MQKRTIIWLGLLTGWWPGIATTAADTLVAELLARYDRIETVTCDVRRDVRSGEGRMRWLSRVHFARGDRLHVENFAPLPRRIIADGTTMYQHSEGQPRGFRRPVADLTEAMTMGLRKVPGTVMDHLFRLADVPEEHLPGTDDYPVRRAYTTDTLYVVLEADATNRLRRLSLYDGDQRDEPTGEISLESFEEVQDGVWIPMLHRSRFNVGGVTHTETMRLGNYTVNAPIPDHLFDASAFFTDVQWVDRFEDLD